MTCKDCIHERVCFALIQNGLPYVDDEFPAETFCMEFKNKTDLVAAIRCKDCKYSRKLYEKEKQMYGENYIGCTNLSTGYNTVVVLKNDYCSYAERKDKQ